jgi:hypothetical protein
MFWRGERLLNPTYNQIPDYKAHCLDTTPANFHTHTVLLHLDIIKVFYSPTVAQLNCL